MQINHNISALNTWRQMSVNSTSTAKSMEKLSSGSRINKAADDAAGLSISEKMRSQIRGLNQGVRNAQDGISFIQTGEGGLSSVSDMLGRMKELTVQRENGTYFQDDVDNMNLEMDALGKAIDDIVQNTKFNGIDVFGAGATIAYGEDAALTLDVQAITFTGGLDNNSTVDDVNAAIKTVNTDRANYGAWQNQLEQTVNNQSTTAENLQASESRIRDVDMAKEMMEFTKNNILVQASQAMLAQANTQPQGVLQLLK